MSQRPWIFTHALAFVAGFPLIFIIGCGKAATLLGQAFGQYKPFLGRIGGVVVIFFGLSTLEVVKIPRLFYDTRPQWQMLPKSGLLASGLMGIFFAAGWTPCIGTTLGAILTLSFSQATVGQGLILSSGYALGLGLPFLAIGWGMEWAVRIVRRFRRRMRAMQIASGLFLLLIGVILLSNQITLIAIWAQKNGLFLLAQPCLPHISLPCWPV